MYNQRRGLAAPSLSSDTDARSANLTLMQSKRRQQLEAQLEEKMELLKQYTNPRGIGMKGQTVPQRDIEMLQQQIANIRQQLEGTPVDPSAFPPTPVQITAGAGGQRMQPQQFAGPPPAQPSLMSHQPSMPSGASSTTSARSTKRDQVWQQKYERWLQRTGGRPAPPLSAVPVNGGVPLGSAQGPCSQSNASSMGFSPAPSSYGAEKPLTSGPVTSGQQQVPPIQYGRRATPPAQIDSRGGYPPSAQPVYQQQQQQQRNSSASGSQWSQAGQGPFNQQQMMSHQYSQQPQQQYQQPFGQQQFTTQQQQQPFAYQQQQPYAPQQQQQQYAQAQQPYAQQQQQQAQFGRRAGSSSSRPW